MSDRPRVSTDGKGIRIKLPGNTEEECSASLEECIKTIMSAPDRGGFEYCLLHPHRRSSGLGLFQPDDSQKWGAPVGQHRTIMYALCARCWAAEDRNAVADQVEAELFKGLKDSPWQ